MFTGNPICLKAKKEYWKEQCEGIEYFEQLGRIDKMYEKVNALTVDNKSKPGNSAAIKDNNGNMVTEGGKEMQIRKNYIEELYSTNSKKNGKIIEDILVDNDEKGPMILRSEVDWAIRNMKNKKATGIDDIPAELLKTLGEEGKELWNLCSLIYEEGH